MKPNNSLKTAPPDIHRLADCQSAHIGAHTKVWQYTVILPGAVIGQHCNICCHCFVENDVVVGNNVTVKSGVYLWDGVRLEDDVFIGPNATFTNDKYPRSKAYLEKFPITVIKKGASIGAAAIILPGITVGENAMVAAGSIVTRDVQSDTLVVGAPARPARKL